MGSAMGVLSTIQDSRPASDEGHLAPSCGPPGGRALRATPDLPSTRKMTFLHVFPETGCDTSPEAHVLGHKLSIITASATNPSLSSNT